MRCEDYWFLPLDLNLAEPTTRAEVAVAGTISRLGYVGQILYCRLYCTVLCCTVLYLYCRLRLQVTQDLLGRPCLANSAPRSKKVQPVCCGRSDLDLYWKQ